MAKLELQLNNGGMNLNIIAVIGNDALLQRLNDSSYIVVSGLHIHNDFSCEWDYAYGYFDTYDQAGECFNDKVVKTFQEYFDVDICSDEDFEGMTVEDLTGIPSQPQF